jgi:hypothetical protein
MTPSIPDRFDSMIQTLADIVIPAIKDDNDLAREQTQLVIAHLAMIRTQLPFADRFDREELESAVALARQLIELAQGGEVTRAAAAALQQAITAADPANPLTRCDANRAINAASEDIVRAVRIDGAGDAASRIARIVLDDANRKVMRDRIWFQDSGFDAERASLPCLSSMFEVSA